MFPEQETTTHETDIVTRVVTSPEYAEGDVINALDVMRRRLISGDTSFLTKRIIDACVTNCLLLHRLNETTAVEIGYTSFLCALASGNVPNTQVVGPDHSTLTSVIACLSRSDLVGAIARKTDAEGSLYLPGVAAALSCTEDGRLLLEGYRVPAMAWTIFVSLAIDGGRAYHEAYSTRPMSPSTGIHYLRVIANCRGDAHFLHDRKTSLDVIDAMLRWLGTVTAPIYLDECHYYVLRILFRLGYYTGWAKDIKSTVFPRIAAMCQGKTFSNETKELHTSFVTALQSFTHDKLSF
jgi:hypothetical protein